MVFSSITFLIFFLPLFLWVYLLVPFKFKNGIALIFSILFYAWGAPTFVFVLLASTIIDFYLVGLMHRQPSSPKKRGYLAASIMLNVGLLVYFKYANFFVENVNAILLNAGFNSVSWTSVALPIGISFYTFQTLTYSIDIYRGHAKPLKKLSDYLLYIMLFPQMIAGPIVRFNSIADQLKSRLINSASLFQGMFRFAIGLGKKVLLANTLGSIAEPIFSQSAESLSTPTAWIGILAYTFQIYFDFSGYSDMAIGLGKMMGFTFPENFDRPYLSTSITTFWRRWHITLGTWMRDYLYIPLGGNKRSKARAYLNLSIVFLLSGLWHGAAWNFIIWGAFHGLFLVLDRLFLLKTLERLPKVFAIAFTFFITIMGWVIFKIESLPEAIDFTAQLFSFTHLEVIPDISSFQLFILIVATVLSFAGVDSIISWWFKFSEDVSKSFMLNFAKLSFTLVLIILSLSWLTTSSFNPFIYFRF